MDGKGEWYHNDDSDPTIAATLIDMRRPDRETWTPGSEVLNPNGTTSGCLAIHPSGILHPYLDDDCGNTYSQACSYKGKQFVLLESLVKPTSSIDDLACMTTDGRQCIFPFIFGNETHPVLEYNICSTLDIFRSWCPTRLNDDRTVAEWGDCLSDCPSENVNSVCLEDPEMPDLSVGSGKSVNFTTDFPFGIGKVTDEVPVRCAGCKSLWTLTVIS